MNLCMMAKGRAPDNHNLQKQLKQNDDGQSISSGSGDSGYSPMGNTGSGLKKGPWTAAEDAVLIEYVKKHGEGNWNAVQRNAGLARCGKSCRLRWTNHLRPNLKKGSFTPEEERMIIKLHSQLGNKWARMAAQLPGRTDNEIKNYWNTRIKRRIRQGLPLYPHEVTTQQLASSAPSSLAGEPPPSTSTTHPQTQAAISTQILIPNGPINQTLSPSLNTMLLSPTYSHQHHYLRPSFSSSLFDPSTSLCSPKKTPFTTSNSKSILGSSPILFNPSHSESTSFPLFSSPMMSSSFPSSQPHIPSQLPNAVCPFQFNPLSCSLNSADNLQSQLDPDQYFSSISVHSAKPELPSSQFYFSQVEKSEEKPILIRSNSMLLLEDLLEDAQAAASSRNPLCTSMNLQEEKLDVSLKAGCNWDATGSVIPPAGNLDHYHSDMDGHKDFHLPFVLGGTRVDNKTVQEMQSLQADLSKLLNAVPGFMNRVKREELEDKTTKRINCMQEDSPKLLNVRGDTSGVRNDGNSEYSNGQLSGYTSGVRNDGNSKYSNGQLTGYTSAIRGHTIEGFQTQQQITPLFNMDASDYEQTLGSSSWDNLPGIR